MSNAFKPKVVEPAAAPAPTPELTPKRLRIPDAPTSRTQASSKRRGRSSLKIDLHAGSAGADGTGVNIPNA